MKYVNGLFCLIALLSWNISSAQSLIEGVQKYSQGEHLSYDPKFIQDHQIKTIEKIVFKRIKGALDSGTIVESSSFRRDGWPEQIEYNDIHHSNLSTITFQYDSIGHLLQKTARRISDNFQPREQMQEMILWTYQGDTIIKKLSYAIHPEISFNYDSLVLSNCDSFEYASAEQTVRVLSNSREHCKNLRNEYFSNNFDHPNIIDLTFYSNNQIKTRSSASTNFTLEKLDSCTFHTTDLTTLFSNIIDYPTCLPKDFNWLSRSQIDTVHCKGDSVSIHLNSSSFPQIHLLSEDLLGIQRRILIVPNEKRIEVQTFNHGDETIQDATIYFHEKEIKHYTFDLKILRTERIISSFFDGELPRFNDQTIDENDHHKEQTNVTSPVNVRTEDVLYKYYDNGMLQSETTINGAGIIFNKTNYNITYYQ